MSVNYYDLLDVEPTASADEIRTAWRSAVAELDPTDRRFRALSAAAETLLDPDRRAALYDEICALRAQAFLTGTGAELFDTLGTRAQGYEVKEENGLSIVTERTLP